jgi:WD40 repeat protein
MWDLDQHKALPPFGATPSYWYTSVAYSPNGKKLATIGQNLCQVWDPTTRKVLVQLKGFKGGGVVAFSPGGKMLATCNEMGLRFWSTATGRKIRPLIQNQRLVKLFAFCPRRNLMAVVERENLVPRIVGKSFPIYLWDLAKGKLVARLSGHVGGVSGLAFSPDGKVLFSGKDNNGDPDEGLKTQLWDVATGRRLHRLKPARGADPLPLLIIKSACFSPNSKYLATFAGPYLVLWDVATGREKRRFRGYFSWGQSYPTPNQTLAFTPDGKTLVTAGDPDSTVRLWDVDTGEEKTAQNHQGRVTALAYSPDGKTLVSIGTDGDIWLWEAETGKEIGRLYHASKQNGSWRNRGALAFSPDGKVLATSLGGQEIRLWKTKDWKRLHTLVGHPAPEWGVESLAFGPGGKTLLSGGATIHQWNVKTGELIRIFPALPTRWGFVYGLAVAPDGKTFATATYFMKTPPNQLTYKSAAEIDKALKKAAESGLVRAEIHIWDASTPQVIRTLTAKDLGQEITDSLAYSPDGKTLASSGRDGVIRFWQARTGRQLCTAPREGRGPYRFLASIAFAPGGKTLAASGLGRTVRLIDPATGKQRRRIVTKHRGRIECLAVSKTGRLATGSSDTTVILRPQGVK